MIKAHKGDKYLKDNAEWLGYHAEEIKHGSDRKNLIQNPEQDLYDDARSVGMQTGGFIRQEQSYEKQSYFFPFIRILEY